jgi:FkbM family methyltransferase
VTKVSRRRPLRPGLATALKVTRPAALTPATALRSVASQSQTGALSPSQAAPAVQPLLERARTQWQHGDWASLAQLDVDAIAGHPDRAKLALLAAAGRQQAGDTEGVRRLIRQALAWGCSQRLASQVLIAGVHNLLGRAASLRGDEERAGRHFEAAVQTADPATDVKLLAHARAVRELVDLGLLPQASAYISAANEAIKRQEDTAAAHAAAHRKVVDIELDVLRERIASLQQQLAQAKREAAIVSPMPGAALAKPPATAATDGKRYYGLNGLDRKLEAYIDFDKGYFVELGANDGVAQSNTLYFEKQRGWRGVLIEPILHSFLKCQANRAADNVFFCAACVSEDYTEPYVRLTYANLMTAPLGVDGDIPDPDEHARSGAIYMAKGERPVEVLAAARTLSSLLEEAGAPAEMDLLSLDVEGGELEVLRGLDPARHRFRYILVECRDEKRLSTNLRGAGYKLVDRLSHHDYLYAYTPT